jgi:hypothetical protein
MFSKAIEETFTLKWQWVKNEAKTFSTNWTSPSVHLELYGPNDEENDGFRMEGNYSIGQYDSIWGNQFVQIQMPKNANPGEHELI